MATSKRCLSNLAGRGIHSGIVLHVHRSAYTLLELMVVLAILTAVMLVAWPRIAGRLQLVAPREAALQLKSDLAEARESAIRAGEPWVVRIEQGSGKYEIGPVQGFRERTELSLAAGQGLSVIENPQLLATPSIDSAENASRSKTDRRSHPGLGAGESDSTEPNSTVLHRELPVGIVFEDGFAHQAYDANVPPDQIPQAVMAQPPQVLPTDPNDTGLLQQPPVQQNPSSIVRQQQNPLPQNRSWKFAVIYQPDGRATDSDILLKEEVTDTKIRLRIRGFTGATTIGDVERRPPQQAIEVDLRQPLGGMQEIQDQQQLLQQQQRGQQGGQPAFPAGVGQ